MGQLAKDLYLGLYSLASALGLRPMSATHLMPSMMLGFCNTIGTLDLRRKKQLGQI